MRVQHPSDVCCETGNQHHLPPLLFPRTSLDRLPPLHAVGKEPAAACGASGHRQAPLTVTLMNGYGAYAVSGTALFPKPCCPQQEESLLARVKETPGN